MRTHFAIRSILTLALTWVMTDMSIAWASPQLARQKNCMTCHSVEARVLGPSFKEIAAKYATQANAADTLMKKVMQGSSGSWGGPAMPANTQLSEADARSLVSWILSLK